MSDRPVASIIIATFNRPQVLSYAIRSVLQSTLTDWELIVVGDGCTDDTEQVVRGFGDPRIRWQNLETNSGNQAAPNNAGVAQARGDYLFFLNHDDMWFGAHMSEMISALDASGADVMFSPVALLQQSGRAQGPPDVTVDTVTLDGVSVDGYDPRTFIIASSWAMRREVADRVGPWKLPEASRLSPSQEWLHRAARLGCQIDFHPHVSVLCIHAGVRKLAYLRDSPEHERAAEWVLGRERPSLELLETIALGNASAASTGHAPVTRLAERVRAGVGRAAERFGAHPHAVERMLTGQRKGGWIAGIHAVTFATHPLTVDVPVPLGDPGAAEHLVDGWHLSEPWGVWSSAARATLGFAVPADVAEPVLELTGHPLTVPTTVTFQARGQAAHRVEFIGPRQTVTIPLGAASGSTTVTVSLAEVTSPLSLGINDDPRSLGFALTTIRLTDGSNT